MNKERLLQLADVIEKQDYKKVADKVDRPMFNMGYEFHEDHPCGTVMCIAGFAAVMFTEGEQLKALLAPGHPSLRPYEGARHARIAKRGREVLDLDEGQAQELFYPRVLGIRRSYSDITAREAVRAIRHLVETGNVEWGS